MATFAPDIFTSSISSPLLTTSPTLAAGLPSGTGLPNSWLSIGTRPASTLVELTPGATFATSSSSSTTAVLVDTTVDSFGSTTALIGVLPIDNTSLLSSESLLLLAQANGQPVDPAPVTTLWTMDEIVAQPPIQVFSPPTLEEVIARSQPFGSTLPTLVVENDRPTSIDLPIGLSDPSKFGAALPIISESNLNNVPIQWPLLPGSGLSLPFYAIVIPLNLAAEAELGAQPELYNNPAPIYTEANLSDPTQFAFTTSFSTTTSSAQDGMSSVTTDLTPISIPGTTDLALNWQLDFI